MKNAYTFEELLDANIHAAYEDENNYYISINSNDVYDDALWVINKKTKDVSYMSCIEFMFGEDEKTPSLFETAVSIDPVILKSVST